MNDSLFVSAADLEKSSETSKERIHSCHSHCLKLVFQSFKKAMLDGASSSNSSCKSLESSL